MATLGEETKSLREERVTFLPLGASLYPYYLLYILSKMTKIIIRKDALRQTGLFTLRPISISNRFFHNKNM